MGIISATSSVPIYAQLVWVLGKLMEGIYFVLGKVHIHNTGLAIIIFTIILYTLMWPLMEKQQKFTRMSSMMNPEIQKVQKKYKGKNDPESMGRMRQETQAIYNKYGMSPSGGCVVSLIQFPILFALYSVIRNLPTYVGQVNDVFIDLATQIMYQQGFQKIMEAIGTKPPINISASRYSYKEPSTLIDVMYKFQDKNWTQLKDKFPSLHSLIDTTKAGANHLNNFLGLNIMESPFNAIKGAFKSGSANGWSGALVWIIIGSVLIPVLAGLTQFISAKIMSSSQKRKTESKDQMQQQMNSMLKVMPLISVWMGFTLPTYLGTYWVVSAVVRTIQAIIINHKIDKIPLDDMIDENKKKLEKKKEKKRKKEGADEIIKMSRTSTKNVTADSNKKLKNMSTKEKQEKLEKAAEARKKASKGSLSAGANLVQKFNSNETDN